MSEKTGREGPSGGGRMSEPLSAHDHGNCELCDQIEADRDRLRALIAKWRENGAQIDMFHATMGSGYKVCADELEATLAAEPPPVTATVEISALHNRWNKLALDEANKERAALAAEPPADRYQRADDAGHQQNWPRAADPPPVNPSDTAVLTQGLNPGDKTETRIMLGPVRRDRPTGE